MTPPFVWCGLGEVRISVSAHAVVRLHSLPADISERLQQMLVEIASSAPVQFGRPEGLLRLHVGAFVVLYNFAADGQGLIVQHVLMPAEQKFESTT